MDIRCLIRRAVDADLLALNTLVQGASAYAGEYHAIIANYVVTPGYLSGHQVFVAEGSGGVLGFYSLIVGDRPELDLMFVSDAAQGLGVGRQLFLHMVETASRCGVEAVHITSHPPAVGFYERMGAVRIGTMPPAGRVTWERPMLRLMVACQHMS